MRVGVVILAAGSSSRFGQDKLSILIKDKPVWSWSVETFCLHPQVQEVVLVASSNNLSQIKDLLSSLKWKVRVVLGGQNRQESSAIGVSALSEDCQIALVHDAARPFVSNSVITGVINACCEFQAAAPVLSIQDTVRLFDETDSPAKILPRENLGLMQTPQGANKELLLKAHAEADAIYTDEMALLEHIGKTWQSVPGEKENLKLTRPDDIQFLIKKENDSKLNMSTNSETETRIGFGYDIHVFSKDPNRPMFLGGILFEGETGLEGHSDADVVLHAIVDALLGASANGDIGHHFPPSEPKWKNVRSTVFLSHASSLIKEAGFTLVNLDCTVIAEHPRIQAKQIEIRKLLATYLQVTIEQIGLKATTNEGLGALGKGEGIAAYAVASLKRKIIS